MIAPNEVSAVLVTRGDVSLDPIRYSLLAQGIEDIVVWDNSVRKDRGIYGRYEAIKEAKHDVIYVQDDDVIVPRIDRILEQYKPDVLTVSYPDPWDIPWPSRGAVFDSYLPGYAFDHYRASYHADWLFTHRICDAVFVLLTETNVIDAGAYDMPHAFAEDRVSTGGGWYDRDRPEAQRRCELLKAAV
jgi:hypothetical protein